MMAPATNAIAAIIQSFDCIRFRNSMLHLLVERA
jgi:hypothetical protein